MIEWFNEVGPFIPGGFGPEPLTFTEIQAWSALRKIEPSEWDVSALRTLSRIYCSELNKKQTNG